MVTNWSWQHSPWAKSRVVWTRVLWVISVFLVQWFVSCILPCALVPGAPQVLLPTRVRQKKGVKFYKLQLPRRRIPLLFGLPFPSGIEVFCLQWVFLRPSCALAVSFASSARSFAQFCRLRQTSEASGKRIKTILRNLNRRHCSFWEIEESGRERDKANLNSLIKEGQNN